MLQTIESEISKNTAIIYASQQFENSVKTNFYENENEEYILLTDPIKRISDMQY